MNTQTPRNMTLIDFRNTIQGKTYGENLTIDSRRLLAWFETAFNLERELTAVTEQRDKLIETIEPLKYWRDISECDCSNPLPQGGCLRCDLERILKPTNPNEL